MVYLIKQNLPPNSAFKIMELVRKGKALKDPKFPEYEALMREHKVPEWYIGSCKKIKYMFPKAHAAAYVMMAFRIAWFKVHIPKAYYSAYFSIRAKAFDAEFMIFGKEKVKEKMKEIETMGNQAGPKDKDMYDDLELVLEMYERGINFLPIDLYKSHATKFLVEEEGLRPPINSIAGMGNVAAEGVYNAVQEAEQEGKAISSIEDLKKRAKIGNSAIESLKKFGCLKGLPESDQICFFDVI
jgi:DNA polymerase-3 subunit alpha (Gram-positive type)